ncbi:MAG: hypothetical protein JW811_08905 [Clostridiales bacterium]|nr:hypothetical protein [Clostridiales bacterium]
MKKLDGTITLSILDEDNNQRVIFRIIPLCTKDGMIFKNRTASYPDFGSLRIIPDKREQSSFKERMREIGNLCCVQLISDGKELTKIRQNRNYDPNQGECNQYAIYSDVICGFKEEAVFEVFQEDQEYSHALTQAVLIQRGKVLLGPVKKDEKANADTLKPFGNEEYLMHTVEDMEGKERTYYWNPDAIVTWRQRKKVLKSTGTQTMETENKPDGKQSEPEPGVKIPIGTKLEILNEDMTNEEQITELNLPVSDSANRLEQNAPPKTSQEPKEAPEFHGTPIAEAPKGSRNTQQKSVAVHSVVEKQITEKHSNGASDKADRRPVENPIENLRTSLQDVWSIPALHQEFIRLLGENKEMAKAIYESQFVEGQTKSAYSAVKAELDEIEGERISLLVELDKVKENYQQIKEKMYSELTKQKQGEIEKLEKRLEELNEERTAVEETLAEIGEKIQSGTMELLGAKQSMGIRSNGSDLTISPVIGIHADTKNIVETVRSTMNDMGFMCKQDCVTEFMVFLSLHDDLCVLAETLPEAELYIRNVLRALGLLNVAAWPSVFGTLHIVSLLPENDQRTPTVEVIKNNRTPIKAYGHKTIRLLDKSNMQAAGILPVIRVPQLNKDRGQENLNETGKPISLQTIHAFSDDAELLYKDGEEWFSKLEKKLSAQNLDIEDEVYQAMRMFARVATPQLIGGFMEAVDAAVLAWIVPQMIVKKYPKDNLEELIGDLPKCMKVMCEENY